MLKSSSNAPITGAASSIRMSKVRFLLGAYASGKAGLVGFIRRHGISSLTLIVHLEMMNTAMNGAPIRNQMAQLQVSSRRSLQAVRKSQVASLHCQRVRRTVLSSLVAPPCFQGGVTLCDAFSIPRAIFYGRRVASRRRHA